MNKKILHSLACLVLLSVVAMGCLGTGAPGRDGKSAPRETDEWSVTENTDSVLVTGQPDRQDFPEPLMAAPVKGERILVREGYTCSYNGTTRMPNYVSWTLTPAKLEGTVKRSGSFYEDLDVPEDERALLDDYYASGYDRGHMCPAADNKWSEEAMMQSFYLSNICPQTHTLNEGNWGKLESSCRSWVKDQNITLYIVCGPMVGEKPGRVLKKHIPVPDRFFKAVVCLDEGQERGIGFVYDNDTEKHPMRYNVCTIDEIERQTGLDLFCALPQEQQDELEAQADLDEWWQDED